MHDVAADVHHHVDVHRAALVPAGVDRLEEREPLEVRPLHPTEEVRACVPGDRAGVDAAGIGMPNVDGRALDRLAGRRVDDGEA